jgi:hypothetical protein
MTQDIPGNKVNKLNLGFTHEDDLRNDVDGEITGNFSHIIVLDDRIELDVILLALDLFIQTCTNIEMQETARDMRRSIASDAGF